MVPDTEVEQGIVYSFTPLAIDADVGIYSGIEISVTDGNAIATLSAFSIEVKRPKIVEPSEKRKVFRWHIWVFAIDNIDCDYETM